VRSLWSYLKYFTLCLVVLQGSRSLALINLHTSLKVETGGAFDAKTISMEIINDGKAISAFYYDSFQNGIVRKPSGERYYINPYLGSFGNHRLDTGINIVKIEFSTDHSKTSHEFIIELDTVINRVELLLLIGITEDSSAYLKDVSFTRIISNPEEISLSFVTAPKMNKAVKVYIQNNSADTLYGNNDKGHFIGNLMYATPSNWRKCTSYSQCIPDSSATTLLPGGRMISFITEEDCSYYLIGLSGKYLFQVSANIGYYSTQVSADLIARKTPRFSIIDQYWLTAEFFVGK
jgi:hypothetical protein